jgi:tetratricopeptide (TPR) repeat protein
MTINGQLVQLENADLLHRLSDEELTFIFKHALVQDSAYRSLLKQDRKRLHRAAGDALEQAYPAQLDENAAVLAQHFAEAGEHEKAIAYARRAARGALARYSVEEAVKQLESALTWAESDQVDESHLILIEEAGDANRLLRNGERALALYQQAIDLWSSRGQAARANVTRLHRKIIQFVVDFKWTVGVDFMTRANQIGDDSRASLQAELELRQGDPAGAETAEALTALSMGAWRLPATPDWDAAEKFAVAAVAMAEQLSDPGILSHALDALASVYDGRSRLLEHRRVALRRLQVARGAGSDDLRERIDALRGAGMAQMYVGEYSQALPILHEAERHAETIQAIELQTLAMGLQAQCLFRLDRWDEVLELEKKWRPLARQYTSERVGVT